ncbi:MAG: HEAT repeat domain-containing protein [Chloroflexia bacterium]|nr:HEAT repeat domain-containing protein [Chloroflexia bacterium]
MPVRQKSFAQSLAEILDPEEVLPHRNLPSLSNLSGQELDLLRQTWPLAPRDRRLHVARTLSQIAEDNLDLNFREVFMLLLRDEEAQVREMAIVGLEDDESTLLLEQLLHMAAKDPALQVRQQALIALGRFTYEIETSDRLEHYRQPLQQFLLELASDQETPALLRRRAVEAVAYLGQLPGIEQAIMQLYQDPSPGMRPSALRAMGRQMSPRWHPLIERELSNADPELRYEAAYACAEMAEAAFVPHLVPLLQDADHEVARAAIYALGEIGGPQARRLLEKCLERSEQDIRDAAEGALRTLRFFEDPLEQAWHP